MAHVADVHVRSARLRATEVQAAEITGLDEVPVLAVAAALSEGTTVFHDVGELRVKESDRFAAVVSMVRAFGATAETEGDDLAVTGVSMLQPARLDAAGDHRMAMAAAVAGLAAGTDETVVEGWQSVATSYPGFDAHLRLLTGFAAHEVGA
jgi:3-phosphoshikimate 1-carboxyvinyltransferase